MNADADEHTDNVALEEGAAGGLPSDAPAPGAGNVGEAPLLDVLLPAVVPVEGVEAAAAAGVNPAGAFPPEASRSVTIPRDAVRLGKFKGDTDTGTLDDFVFALNMYFESQPHVYDIRYNPSALGVQLVVILGCFPAGSVAAVWFRSMYKQGLFTSYERFLELFTAHFQLSASALIGLQAKWEDARQLRNQSCNAYYAYLLQQQAALEAVAWRHRPSDATLLNKCCASLRPDLKRFLQEKRIDNPDYTISQLVQAATVRENATRQGAPVPNLNSVDGKSPSKNQKFCFFCKKNGHDHTEYRKIKAKKDRGEWKERPRPARLEELSADCCLRACVA
jgi:hypothetical protein